MTKDHSRSKRHPTTTQPPRPLTKRRSEQSRRGSLGAPSPPPTPHHKVAARIKKTHDGTREREVSDEISKTRFCPTNANKPSAACTMPTQQKLVQKNTTQKKYRHCPLLASPNSAINRRKRSMLWETNSGVLKSACCRFWEFVAGNQINFKPPQPISQPQTNVNRHTIHRSRPKRCPTLLHPHHREQHRIRKLKTQQ